MRCSRNAHVVFLGSRSGAECPTKAPGARIAKRGSFPLEANLGSGSGGRQMPEPWRKTGRKASDDHYLGLNELAVVEAAAYHEDGSRMGHLLFQLLRSDPLGGDSDGGKSWGGIMLAIEDPYYSWWFESTFGALTEGKEVFFHFCRQPQNSCSFRGGYADLIHVDVWRILSKDEVLNTRWLGDDGRAQVEQLKRAPPTNTAPAAPPGVVQPGAAGVTGLRSALEGTALVEAADAKPATERKRKRQPDGENDEQADKKGDREESDDSASYGQILRRRKPVPQAESALKLRRTKKKKRTSKKKAKQANSDTDDSSDESSEGSVFRVAPLPEGIDRLKRTHLKQPGRLADLTLQRYRELLMRSTGRGAELGEQDKMPSVARAYLQQVYFVKNPTSTLGQRTTREMRTLMLVVDYLTMNMVPSALDVLLQRQKALELSIKQQNWQQANHLELVDMEEARSYFTQELKAAQNEVKAEQKLGKGWGPSYRPSQSWRPPAPPVSGIANKEQKDGDAAPPNEESRKGKKGKKGKGRGRW